MIPLAYTQLALKFYFLLLEDESLAISLSEKTLRSFGKKIGKLKDQDSDILFLKEIFHNYKKIKAKLEKIPSETFTQGDKSAWSIPHLPDFTRWKKYLTKTNGDFEAILVLRYVLKFPTTKIAEALGVPEGTVLFRIGLGLGQMERLL